MASPPVSAMPSPPVLRKRPTPLQPNGTFVKPTALTPSSSPIPMWISSMWQRPTPITTTSRARPSWPTSPVSWRKPSWPTGNRLRPSSISPASGRSSSPKPSGHATSPPSPSCAISSAAAVSAHPVCSQPPSATRWARSRASCVPTSVAVPCSTSASMPSTSSGCSSLPTSSTSRASA